jgi:transcriptional regulator with XRE-family HTH domain
MTKLRKLRKDRGLTAQELADKSGVTYRNILHYELGDRRIDGAKLDTIINLAIALNCNVIDILEDEQLIIKLKIYAKML